MYMHSANFLKTSMLKYSADCNLTRLIWKIYLREGTRIGPVANCYAVTVETVLAHQFRKYPNVTSDADLSHKIHGNNR